jgi:hypothetical protein
MRECPNCYESLELQEDDFYDSGFGLFCTNPECDHCGGSWGAVGVDLDDDEDDDD